MSVILIGERVDLDAQSPDCVSAGSVTCVDLLVDLVTSEK